MKFLQNFSLTMKFCYLSVAFPFYTPLSLFYYSLLTMADKIRIKNQSSNRSVKITKVGILHLFAHFVFSEPGLRSTLQFSTTIASILTTRPKSAQKSTLQYGNPCRTFIQGSKFLREYQALFFIRSKKEIVYLSFNTV